MMVITNMQTFQVTVTITIITTLIALMMFDCSRCRRLKYLSDVYTPVHTVAARSRL